ncbi:MAG: hypothetical protein GC156_10900 [Actinomycetales bacterium]|nr:hypothetical protein [Actinomycetales bacterium]
MTAPAAILATLAAMALGPTVDIGTAPHYYWRWSDGSTAAVRTLDERVSGLPPAIVVTADPARAGRLVELQFRSASGWRTEDATRTDRSGRARLEVNPYCADGAWCRGSLSYRLRVDGRSATLRLRFSPAASG